MKNFKIALIGAGYWGKNLLRNFYELGALEIVVELNPQLVTERKKNFPDVNFTEDFESVLNSSNIQGVAIAAPAALHYKLAKKALLKGKDVFVEKPLALDIKEGEELVKLAKENSKILMVGHILQYHPAIIKLKELMKSNVLGEIEYLYSHRLSMGKLRNEENILWSFAPHDVSVVLGLTEKFPKVISATGSSYVQKNIYDMSMVEFTFENNIKGHIFVSWLHPFKEQKLVIIGTKKMAVFDDTVADKLVLYSHKVKWENKMPIAVKGEKENVPLEAGEPLKNECKAFLQAIQNRTQPITNGNEGLNVLKFLKYAEESMSKEDTNQIEKKYFNHPSAVIDEGAQIGKGTKIWHFTHVMSGAKIGENCIVGQNVYVDKKAVIGNGVKIQNNVSIYDDVILEDDVFCGPSMVFTNVINPRSHIERKDEYKTTLVKQRASIGANATIVCGNTIGKGAFVGAGAVVTKDIPDYALVVGSPAKVIGWMCECGVKLHFNGDKAKCDRCGAEYKKVDNTVHIL